MQRFQGGPRQVQDAPPVQAVLRLGVLAADMAEAVFKESALNCIEFEDTYHVNMTTHERPINPGCLQNSQLESARHGLTVWS